MAAIDFLVWEESVFLNHPTLHQGFKRALNPGTNQSYLYTPNTLNIDLILLQTQLILCAENVKSWLKSWLFPFTFQAYILPHTLNYMRVSLFEFRIWAVLVLPKTAGSAQTHKSISFIWIVWSTLYVYLCRSDGNFYLLHFF